MKLGIKLPSPKLEPLKTTDILSDALPSELGWNCFLKVFELISEFKINQKCTILVKVAANL